MNRSLDNNKVLNEVGELLRVGRARDAMDLLARVEQKPLELQNAYGVCLLRLGQFEKAVGVFRSLVIKGSTTSIREEAPAVLKTNYATALLLMKNVVGCMDLLDEVHDEKHPAVMRLRSAIDRWKQTLSWTQRFLLRAFGILPNGSVPIDFPPGDLLPIPETTRPKRPRRKAA